MVTVPTPAPRSLVVAVSAAVAAVAVLLFTPFPARASDDPLFAKQWALAKIGAEPAWSRSTGAGVRVGIVDTGVDLGHEDLAGKVVASTSCIGSDGDPGRCAGSAQDDNGHGTHVSGIVAATRGNGRGVAGVAPDAQLVVARALKDDQTGDGGATGSVADIDAAIRWVVDHGARVVNLSVGAGGSVITSILGGGSSSLADGVEYAWNSGAIPVLASGNDQAALLGGSANYGSLDAMVVGATGPNDEVAGYSSPLGNAKWGLVAPGGDGGGDTAHQIASTFWVRGMSNQYAVLEGTSMAAPHVTAAAALLLAQGLSRDQAVQRLLDSANRGVACGGGCHGRLDVLQAVGGPAPATAPSAATPAAPATTARPAAAPAAAPTTAAPAPATTAPPTTAAPATTTAPSSPPSTEPSNTNVAVRLLTPKGKGGGLGEDHPVLLAVAILSVLSAGGLTAMSLVRRVR